MILKDLNPNATENSTSDQLILCKTNDGSLSLKSLKFKECFHSLNGATKEAKEKFIAPSGLHRYSKNEIIFVLDICVGMGYNTACLMEALLKQSTCLNYWGLEIDKNPLQLALGNESFRSNWTVKVLDNLKQIARENQWKDSAGKGKILWGDARKTINDIPEKIKFDLIYLDPFSPQQCPQLWSEEFLQKISSKLSKGGRLITYCRAAAIRASLKRTGLIVNSIIPKEITSKVWSLGTIALKDSNGIQDKSEQLIWDALNQKENDHLATTAAIPYRDPTGNSSAIEIMRRRRIEQLKSNFKSTSSWKKRWANTKES